MAGKAIPEITIDGEAIEVVSHLTLDQPWNGHHSFSLVCPLRERLNSILDLGKKYVGKEITIQLRTGVRRSAGELLFKGIITNLKLSKHESATMQLVLQGFAPTRKMDDGPHLHSFTDMTLEDIAKEISNTFGITPVTSMSYSDPLPYVTQYKESGFQFLRRIMSTYGQWFYYDGKDLIFGEPIDGQEAELTFGRDLTGLDISADVVPPNFKLLGYNYIDDQHFDSTADQSSVSEMDDLTEQAFSASTSVFEHEPLLAEPFPNLDQVQLDYQAQRRLSGKSARLINLFGQSSRLDLKLGQVVMVKALSQTLGIGDLDENADYGTFRILHITHHFDGSGNYENNFQGIPAKLKQPPSGDKTITPPMAEMQPAEVMDNHDPEELGRIQVQFPWQKELGAMTPWIRVSASGAGGGHGAYFVPEKGDQVMIGFEFNNPDRPFVLGSVYNGSTKHADAADPDNNSKIIRTRSGNQIKMSDEGGKESIIIENGTNVITLSLDGSTSISITTTGDLSLSGKNITITAEEELSMTSGKKTAMTAGEKTEVTADKGVDINGTKEVKLSAQDVTIEAQKGFKASGMATAEVGGANTTVKGDAQVSVTAPMVKLN